MLASVGEVLASVGKLVCGYMLVRFFLSSLILSAGADTNMGSVGKCWEVLGSVGKCWEVLGGVGRCWSAVIRWFMRWFKDNY